MSGVHCSILKEGGWSLLQKSCNPLLAIREREATVIRGPLNLQPRVQRGRPGLFLSAACFPYRIPTLYLPALTADLAILRAGADRVAMIWATCRASSSTSLSAGTTLFITPRCSISFAVTGSPVNINSRACRVRSVPKLSNPGRSVSHLLLSNGFCQALRTTHAGDGA